jgi:hypothetical protein
MYCEVVTKMKKNIYTNCIVKMVTLIFNLEVLSHPQN